jgi:pyruvate dehydrogenase E1 component alpha subunit
MKKKTSLKMEDQIRLYRDMLFYRRFEEAVQMAYTKQKFSGFCHLHIGQEAVCAGIQACLNPEDYMISGYRSHTQAIAKGIPEDQVFAELFGKEGGCSKGKGGSMHMFSREHRFLGGHGIVGGQAPLAAGVGFSIRYQTGSQIIVCYLGDAAMNQGQVFEAMNMAATWALPCLFVIENNRYGMGTDIRRTTSVDSLSKRALAFDMKHGTIDGMNLLSVYDGVKPVIEDMRKDHKPYLLEVMTYRFKGHSVSDPGTYRTKEEVASYQEKDPLIQLKNHLLQEAYASHEDFALWEREVKDRVRKAEDAADRSPEPSMDQVWTHVFAP